MRKNLNCIDCFGIKRQVGFNKMLRELKVPVKESTIIKNLVITKVLDNNFVSILIEKIGSDEKL